METQIRKPLETQRELLEACGISTRDMTLERVYDLASAVIKDSVVTILAQNYMRNTRHLRSREEQSVMKAGTRAHVIRTMPMAERAALRDRVLGVVQLPASK